MDFGIGAWPAAQCRRNPDAVALVDGDGGTRLTYRQLDDRVARVAGALRADGVRPGDRVGLLSTNHPDMLVVIFAVAAVGAVCVPANFRLTADELAYVFGDSGAEVLVVSADLDALGADVAGRDALAIRRTIVVAGDPSAPGSLDVFIDDAPRLDGAVPAGPSGLALIMYTSGTTGHPKGAMLTHGNIMWNAIDMLSAGEGLLHTDVTLSVAPLFHIGALGIFTLPLLYLGGTVVTVSRFDPALTAELMTRERVTVQFLVPAMWNMLARSGALDGFDDARIRWVLSGGAPCPLPVIRYYADRGWPFLEGFGLTETSPTCTVMDTPAVATKAGSVGRALRHVECRVVDDEGRPVPDGEAGELTVRGPNVFSGYWRLPEATAAALVDGWFHTGDVAVRDAEGYVTIVDRKKDMVITGGENVYPVEVERVLTQMPGVADAAVVGVPDERWGERVTAVVVPAPGVTLTAEQVIAFCRERLAAYKCPRAVETVEEIPRNATGKILKRTLRVRYGTSAAVTR